MKVCMDPKCVALATDGDQCAPHAAGYKKHDTTQELRCADCRGLIKKDDWYQARGGAMFHVKACKVHPDVLAERAEKAKQAAAV